MVNYQNGKIYKIECHQTGLIYIGSTSEPTLARRLSNHIRSYHIWKNTGKRYITSFKIFENENYDISLLESYPCNTRDELKAREKHYIKTMECVNKNIPLRSKSEYHQDNKEKIAEKKKQFREDNKEKLTQKSKMYYDDNKETILENKKQYHNENKETILEKKKQYYNNNKELIAEKSKKYHIENKEHRNLYSKQYREQNNEELKEKRIEYYLKNKEKRNEYNKQYQLLNREKILEQKKLKRQMKNGEEKA